MTDTLRRGRALRSALSRRRREGDSGVRVMRRALSPGHLVGGRYRIERKVATGGMGEVWEAEHLTIHSRVAIKALLPEALLNHEIVVRLKREAVILGRIRSHHIARVVDFLVDEACGPLLVTEFVEGKSLHDLVTQAAAADPAKPRGALTVEQAVELGIDLATGLRELHRANVVHRDLKPANVILQPCGEGKTLPVIVDFGVSRVFNTSDEPTDDHITAITNRDIAVGTIEFMAPEQILRSSGVTPSADLYALGSLLYRAVSGQNVFGALSRGDFAYAKLTREAPPLETGRTDRVAVGLADVVARALERKPAERYESADEMLADLCLLRDAARRAARARRSETSVSGVRPVVTVKRGSSSTRRRSALFRHAKTAATAFGLVASLVVGAQIGRHATAPAASELHASSAAPPAPPAAVPAACVPAAVEPTAEPDPETVSIELPVAEPEAAPSHSPSWAQADVSLALTKDRERALMVAIAQAARGSKRR